MNDQEKRYVIATVNNVLLNFEDTKNTRLDALAWKIDVASRLLRELVERLSAESPSVATRELTAEDTTKPGILVVGVNEAVPDKLKELTEKRRRPIVSSQANVVSDSLKPAPAAPDGDARETQPGPKAPGPRPT